MILTKLNFSKYNFRTTTESQQNTFQNLRTTNTYKQKLTPTVKMPFSYTPEQLVAQGPVPFPKSKWGGMFLYGTDQEPELEPVLSEYDDESTCTCRGGSAYGEKEYIIRETEEPNKTAILTKHGGKTNLSDITIKDSFGNTTFGTLGLDLWINGTGDDDNLFPWAQVEVLVGDTWTSGSTFFTLAQPATDAPEEFDFDELDHYEHTTFDRPVHRAMTDYPGIEETWNIRCAIAGFDIGEGTMTRHGSYENRLTKGEYNLYIITPLMDGADSFFSVGEYASFLAGYDVSPGAAWSMIEIEVDGEWINGNEVSKDLFNITSEFKDGYWVEHLGLERRF